MIEKDMIEKNIIEKDIIEKDMMGRILISFFICGKIYFVSQTLYHIFLLNLMLIKTCRNKTLSNHRYLMIYF